MITVDDDGDSNLSSERIEAQKDLRFYSAGTTREQNIKTGFESNNLSGNSTWHTIKSFSYNNAAVGQWNMGSVEVHCAIKQASYGPPRGRVKAFRDFYLIEGSTFRGGTLTKTDSLGDNSQVEFQIIRSGTTLLLQYQCTNSNTTSVSGTIEIIGSNFNFFT
jgi:hypothetical protein